MDFNDQQALAGQTAIITGGAGGIGRATCITLARLGASVVVIDLDAAQLEQTAKQIAAVAGAPAPLILSRDIRSEADMEDMAKSTLEKFGRIDILVHCAGILRGRGSGPKMLVDAEVTEWEEVIDTNLKGTFLCNRAVLPAMVRERRGQIVNIASTSGLQGRALDSIYCASKFGVVGLSQALAEEVRQYGVRVQVVAPDAVDTSMWDQNGPIRPPADSLAPDRVANLIAYMVTMPLDAALGQIVITPLRFRRRKKPEVADKA